MAMFDNLRRAFREAVDNFKEELNRDDVPEAVDRLLAGMQEEVTDAKAYVKKLEEDIGKALRAAEREKKEAATCRRREEMARRINDEETARVAVEFAEKHERRQEVLEQKALAMREEMEVRRAEVEDMLEQIKDARSRRDSLAAGAGRTQARESLREADDLFSELDRMADKIGDMHDRNEAERDVAEEFGEFDDLDAEVPPVSDVDERLRELKRRMGEE